MVDLIIACDDAFGIGYQDRLPWNVPEEMQIFKRKTLGCVLLAGTRTYKYLLPRKLEDRILVNISHTLPYEQTVEYTKEAYPDKKIFVIGGSKLYNYCFSNPNLINIVHISFMKGSYVTDVKVNFPIEDYVILSKEEHKDFVHYELKYFPTAEKQYKNILSEVLRAPTRIGRNGEVKSLFFNSMTFDLRSGFPLLTTKKMFFRGIVEELLFFLRGDTDSKILEEKGINIWKKNTSKEFIEENRKNLKEGEMGPMYGYNWRFFGKPYGDESQTGFDQLSYVVDTILTDPTSRRILMTSFDPATSRDCVLYPCHSIVIQFYVEDNFLDMFCYNRSQDLFLGVPFNIASSALLLTIVANMTGLTARKLFMTLGDCHIYKEHYEAVELQLKRINYTFPEVKITKSITLENLSSVKLEDFTLENYNYHPGIKADMVA